MGGAKNDFKMLHNTYYGSGMRGIVVDNPTISTNKMFWRVQIDQSFPIFPGKLFFDIAGGDGFDRRHYAVAGVLVGPVIIPIYQNWENKSKIPDDINWIKNRLRFMLDLKIPIGR